MANAAPVVAGALALGVVAALVIAAKARAAPVPLPGAPPEVPEAPPEAPTPPREMISQEDILAAIDFQELDDYYNEIALLYRGWHISFEEYMKLYDAYVQRFYELWGQIQ